MPAYTVDYNTTSISSRCDDVSAAAAEILHAELITTQSNFSTDERTIYRDTSARGIFALGWWWNVAQISVLSSCYLMKICARLTGEPAGACGTIARPSGANLFVSALSLLGNAKFGVDLSFLGFGARTLSVTQVGGARG